MLSYCPVCGVYSTPIDPPCNCPEGASLEVLAAAVARLKLEIVHRQRIVDDCQKAIKAALVTPGARMAGDWLVSWSSYQREQLDGKRLKAEQPELWRAYLSSNEVHTVRVSRSMAVEDLSDDIPF